MINGYLIKHTQVFVWMYVRVCAFIQPTFFFFLIWHVNMY